MGTLPYSIGFSLILALLTWFSYSKMSQEVASTIRSIETLSKERMACTEKIGQESRSTYYSLTKKENEEDLEEERERETLKKRTGPKKRNKGTTSKLHIKEIFSAQTSPLQETELKLFQNLLKILYGSLPIFSENMDQTAQIQELFDEIRTTFIGWGDKHNFKKSEHLGDVVYTGSNASQKQFILTMILKGGNAEFILGSRCVVPKLIDYISAFHRDTCMSVYKAPEPILLALFQDPSIVQEVMDYRAVLYSKITKKNKDGTEEEVTPESLSADFRARFESKIPSGIEPRYIDFTVTKGAPINSLEKKSSPRRPHARANYSSSP